MKRARGFDNNGATETKRADTDRVSVKDAPIERVFFPKQAPAASNSSFMACVVVGNRKWKGQFFSIDMDMFVHTITGHMDTSGRSRDFKEPTYLIDSITTQSVPMCRANANKFIDILSTQCFPEEDRANWNENDKIEFISMARAIDWDAQESSGEPFHLGTWLVDYADAGEAWAEYVKSHPFARVYIMCIDAGRLLAHYKVKHLESLTIEQRLLLLKWLDEKPFSLCFRHEYAHEFPYLPELAIDTLPMDVLSDPLRVGVDRVYAAWLYAAVRLNEELCGDTYIRVEKGVAGRLHAAFGAARKKRMQRLHKQFEDLITRILFAPSQRFAGNAPDVRNDIRPAQERLQASDAVFMWDSKLTLRSTWDRALRIGSFLRGFFNSPVPPGNNNPFVLPYDADEAAAESKYEGSLTEDDWVSILTSEKENKSALLQPARKKQLKRPGKDQKAALKAISEHKIVIVLGGGGVGKTELIDYLYGRGEQQWAGEMKVAEDHPSEFFSVGKVRVVSRAEGKDAAAAAAPPRPRQVFLKAELLILTPTGNAARVAHKRTGVQAHTAKYAITYERHQPGRFSNVRTLVLDEIGLYDEQDISDVFDMCRTWPHLARIVMLGDHNQLESVGSGQVLVDMMRTWLPQVFMRENFRVSPESKALTTLALAIADKDGPAIMAVAESKEASQVFTQRRSYEVDLVRDFYEPYRDGRMDDVQIMSFRNSKCDQLNAEFMRIQGFTYIERKRGDDDDADDDKGHSHVVQPIFVGEKITFTKNKNKKGSYSLQNGQIEVITDMYDVDAKVEDAYQVAQRAWDLLTDEDKKGKDPPQPPPRSFVRHSDAGTTYARNRPYKRFAECKSGLRFPVTNEILRVTQPAYCVTVHRMQGKGVPRAALWAENEAPVYRKLLYTAETRASAAFEMIWDVPPRCMLISKLIDASKYDHAPRQTILADFIGKDKVLAPEFKMTCPRCTDEFTFASTVQKPWQTWCSVCEKVLSSKS